MMILSRPLGFETADDGLPVDLVMGFKLSTGSRPDQFSALKVGFWVSPIALPRSSEPNSFLHFLDTFFNDFQENQEKTK